MDEGRTYHKRKERFRECWDHSFHGWRLLELKRMGRSSRLPQPTLGIQLAALHRRLPSSRNAALDLQASWEIQDSPEAHPKHLQTLKAVALSSASFEQLSALSNRIHLIFAKESIQYLENFPLLLERQPHKGGPAFPRFGKWHHLNIQPSWGSNLRARQYRKGWERIQHHS